ncbi:MAG: hypothetical protein JXP34_05930 [Planctomycetes bacterium]|nr:hypothetical protein [Planctomycetota bacterium]
MKNWIPLGLSLAALFLAGFTLLLRQEGRMPVPAGETASAPDLSDIRDHLDAIDGRLRIVEGRTERLAADRPPQGGAATPAEDPSSPGSPARPVAPAAPPDLEKAFSSYEGFEGLILGILEQDRLRKQEEARLRAEERRQEWEELRKGPYGQYNMKVNSMAKALSMDQNQQDAYHQLLTQYADRFSELTKNTNWRDPQSVTSYQERQKAMQEDFDQDVVRLLTPLQGEEYLRLPQWQRQPTGGAVVTSFSGGDAQAVEVKVNTPGGTLIVPRGEGG